MTKQIAVRLPDHLVTFLDQEVAAGARSRAAVVEAALERAVRRRMAEQDLEILEALGEDPYPELTAFARSNARRPLGLD